MRDTEFFQRAIGLEKPWRVKEVKMDVGAKKVEVEVECTERTIWASAAGERLHIHDSGKTKLAASGHDAVRDAD